MIYTITLNPAIDLFIDTEKMQPNTVNRTQNYDIQANGKGINVSFILKKIGLENQAIGVGGGFTADYIKNELKRNHIPCYFAKSKGITRINVFTRVVQNNEEYKLVNPGPIVEKKEQSKILNYLTDNLKKDDVICISGSFSKGISPNILNEFSKIAKRNDARVVLDTAYKEVLGVLKYHPWIIKPNEDEIKHWFGISQDLNKTQLAKLGKKLVERGAQLVLISLGSDGALLISSKTILYGNAPKIEVLNTAGAGDSMLGTFMGSLLKKNELASSLKSAIAAGSDAASREWITDFSAAAKLKNEIKIDEIKV
ncbi:MAG: 1-phosphofructokinase [Liquorilactobacillus ghanensis]|uniref:1-phosphofructokinase n=1 Tax=Liquorilactobacillus ghanensis TaxID=399370 RepID=UPI0039EAB2BE